MKFKVSMMMIFDNFIFQWLSMRRILHQIEYYLSVCEESIVSSLRQNSMKKWLRQFILFDKRVPLGVRIKVVNSFKVSFRKTEGFQSKLASISNRIVSLFQFITNIFAFAILQIFQILWERQFKQALQLTVRMLNLSFPEQSGNRMAETPIKKTKVLEIEQHTAESDQPTPKSFEDIDPQQLFEKFNQIVRISEDDEPLDDYTIDVQRALDYETTPAFKLDFEPKTSSMKKKPNMANRSPQAFKGINLFQVMKNESSQLESEKDVIPLDPKNCLTPKSNSSWMNFAGLSRAARKQQDNEE